MPRGTRTSVSHARITLVRSPRPSEPRTRTVGRRASTSCGSMLFSSAAPTTCQPASRASSSVRGKLRAACTSISSIAPALALLTTGVSGAEFFAETSTPDAPRKKAERRSAPRFCGSVTSSSASQSGASAPSVPSSLGGGSFCSGANSSGSHNMTMPWCGLLSHIMLSWCLSARSTVTPASAASSSTSATAPPSLRFARSIDS
mmetsp:Transcript_4703/g.13936  ORF Transcript_4703/g.13936 Transcript_4703/m.13936 type:complete len:203 (-) Transcript_4703:102-710(-)